MLHRAGPEAREREGAQMLMPVACNADAAGRTRNRRVEAWLAAR